MMRNYPDILKPLLDDYVSLIKNRLENCIIGVYLYGSIALESYDEGTSDIDFVTVLKKESDETQLQSIKEIHDRLSQMHPNADRMDGFYVSYGNLGKSNDNMGSYPFVHGGKVQEGHWDINHVTWWSLKRFAVTLFGIDNHNLPIPTNWSDVEDTMQFNLKVYWRGRAARIETLLDSEDVSDAVLTLCRINYTMSERLFMSKVKAGQKFLNENENSKWRVLIEEALQLRTQDLTTSSYNDKESRAVEITQFVDYMVGLHTK